MIIEWELEQGSEDWLKARCGVMSASKFGEIFTPTGKPATGAKVENYVNETIAGRLTGKPVDGYKSSAMERGNELEPHARAWYEMATGETVRECGIVYKDSSKTVSCSPDGLILANAVDDPAQVPVVRKGLEIKCPLDHTHVKNMLSGQMPGQYIPQVQGCMYVTGAAEWDFLSYHPDMEPVLVTIKRDEAWIKAFEVVLMKNLKAVAEGYAKLAA